MLSPPKLVIFGWSLSWFKGLFSPQSWKEFMSFYVFIDALLSVFRKTFPPFFQNILNFIKALGLWRAIKTYLILIKGQYSSFVPAVAKRKRNFMSYRFFVFEKLVAV
jgi:hypothetical protein